LQLPLGCTLNCRTLLGSNKKIYGAWSSFPLLCDGT
jgi:hypothetical protein